MTQTPEVETLVLTVDPSRPDVEAMRRAADVILAGGLVAFPTETVYGLGANALDADAVARIFAAKGRPAGNPLIVHVLGAGEAASLVAEWPETAARLAERFWPGPLTLVLPRSDVVPDVVTGGGPTVGIRCPAHPVAQALLRAAGVPIAAPSANRSSRISPTTAAHVLRGLRGRIDVVLDAGPTPGGVESTVLDLTTDPPAVLRPGLVTADDLAAVLGDVQVRSGAGPTEGRLRSPGLLVRHYAPSIPLELTPGDGRVRVEELAAAGRQVGWMPLARPGLRLDPPARVTAVPMPAAPGAYAAQLYAVLHGLEDAGVERIVAEMPPDAPPWLAVRDRLTRAAA